MLFLRPSLPIAHLYRLFWRPGVIMVNTVHAKNAENNEKSDERLGRNVVINGIMTKISITITAATTEILNNTDAEFSCPFKNDALAGALHRLGLFILRLCRMMLRNNLAM